MVAFAQTIKFRAQHPVTINWGDGTTDWWATSPARHLYPTRGPYFVTISDTVNGLYVGGPTAVCPDWAGVCADNTSWAALAARRPTWDDVPDGGPPPPVTTTWTDTVNSNTDWQQVTDENATWTNLVQGN